MLFITYWAFTWQLCCLQCMSLLAWLWIGCTGPGCSMLSPLAIKWANYSSGKKSKFLPCPRFSTHLCHSLFIGKGVRRKGKYSLASKGCRQMEEMCWSLQSQLQIWSFAFFNFPVASVSTPWFQHHKNTQIWKAIFPTISGYDSKPDKNTTESHIGGINCEGEVAVLLSKKRASSGSQLRFYSDKCLHPLHHKHGLSFICIL